MSTAAPSPLTPLTLRLDGRLPPLTMMYSMTLPSVTSVVAEEAEGPTDVLAIIAFEDDFPELADPLLRSADQALGGNLRLSGR